MSKVKTNAVLLVILAIELIFAVCLWNVASDANELRDSVLMTVSAATVEEESEPEEVTPPLSLSEEEINLIALVTMGEAEGEPEEGKRLVIDTILNRADLGGAYGSTVKEVIYMPNQYTCMWDGRRDACYVKDDIRQLVIEELQSRTNYDVLYFRTDHYHDFGTPVMQVGNHYFSTN